MLHDSVDEPEPRDGARARRASCRERAYVVDLAWLRTTPWRERLAAYFDPPAAAPRCSARSAAVTVRHGPDSEVAGAADRSAGCRSRLGWKPERLVRHDGGVRRHGARAPRRGRAARSSRSRQDVPGLAGVTIETADGASLALDRGAGRPARAPARGRDGQERAWTVLGASRGEGGILGEGIRQALLRDPTYQPALQLRAGLRRMRQIIGDVPLGGSPFPPIADYAFLSDCETCALVAPSGNVEWMCLPRFDSPSVFGAMLDRDAGGFLLAPLDDRVPASRRYLPGTNILETTWGTKTGWVIVRDLLVMGPWHDDARALGARTAARRPTGTPSTSCCARCAACNGSVEIHLECEPIVRLRRASPCSGSTTGDGYHQGGRARRGLGPRADA